MNYQAFMAVISLIAAAYALITRQAKLGLGLLVYAITFFLLMPDIAFGIKSDFVVAIALVLFIFGSFVIVWKKAVGKPVENDSSKDAKDINEF